MGESPPDQSNLATNFSLSRIADFASIGTAFGLVNRALNGDRITADDIPEGMNGQILQMVIGDLTPENIERFLTSEDIMPKIVEGLRADTLTRVKEDGTPHPPEDTIIAQHVFNMTGEELKTVLPTNAAVAESFKSIIEDKISKHLSEGLNTTELGNVLGFGSMNGIYRSVEVTATLATDNDETDSTATIEGPFSIPNEILSKNITDPSIAQDLVGLDNNQLAEIIPRLPNEIFENSVLAALNEKLPEGQKITLEGDSLEARQNAFNAAVEAISSNESTFNIRRFNLAALVADENDVKNEIFNTIREGIPAAVQAFQDNLPELAQQEANEVLKRDFGDAVIIDESGNIQIDFEKLDPEHLKALIDQNKTEIAEVLTKEENWPTIQAMITPEMIRAKKDEILPHIIPEITEQGLNTFTSFIDGLPPQFKQLIQGLLGWVSSSFQSLGLDIDMFAPDVNRTAPAAPEAPDQDRAPVVDTIVPP